MDSFENWEQLKKDWGSFGAVIIIPLAGRDWFQTL